MTEPAPWIGRLVDRAYGRGEARALDPPDGPPVDEDEAARWRFEDVVYRYVSGRDLDGIDLRVLDGGGTEGSAVVERRPQAQQNQAAEGCKPPVVPKRGAAGAAPRPQQQREEATHGSNKD